MNEKVTDCVNEWSREWPNDWVTEWLVMVSSQPNDI